MKNSVFVKVLVEDELPVSFGMYVTNFGLIWYNNGIKEFSSDHGFVNPSWWLKEVVINAENYEDSPTGKLDYNHGYADGANYILSKLK